MTTTPERQRARRELANLRSFIRRTGLTGWVDRSAAGNYRGALAAVIAVEDAEGVEAAADLGDRLTALRDEARAAGLLSPSEELEAGRMAIAGPCQWFAGCGNAATTTRRGPIGGGQFGEVPICERCDARVAELER